MTGAGFESDVTPATRRALFDLQRRMRVPTGTFLLGGWVTAPTGYLLLDGSTVTGGVTLHPGLVALFPGWASGDDLVLPDVDSATLDGLAVKVAVKT
jgi:hypothetical protein